MRVGIVGCGKMARAIADRWLQAGVVQRSDLQASTSRAESAAEVQTTLGIACDTDAARAVTGADVVLLACKPQQAEAVVALASKAAKPGQIWLSVLAGIPTAKLAAWLPDGVTVLRAMPNTPVRLGLGVVALCGGTAADRQAVQGLLQPLGQVVEVEEPRFDAFTAIAGCGPAYVFRFLEALQAAAEQQGFDPDTAQSLALQVAEGSLALARQAGRPAAELRAEVTSKGGMTEAALAHLAAVGWAEALGTAVEAARARGEALGRG